jgi:hypothetical protein
MSIHRLTAAATLIAAAGASHALETHWNAASGELPNVVDPAWTLVDEGGGSPSFANGVLTLQTSGGHSARQYYTMQGAELARATAAPRSPPARGWRSRQRKALANASVVSTCTPGTPWPRASATQSSAGLPSDSMASAFWPLICAPTPCNSPCRMR